MRTCLLINSHAGPSTSNEPLHDELRGNNECEVRELNADDDWDAILDEVVRSECERIAVAGGDGTVLATVNALLRAGSRTTLSIIPLGTGNDLSRTLAIPFDPKHAFRLIRTGEVRSIDAVRVSGDHRGYFGNAATGGFSGQVAAEVTRETKSAWGPFAYLRGAIGPLNNLSRFHLRIQFDGQEPENFDVLNLVIANGRTAAGGLPVAPTANPEDGLLDVVLVRFDESLDLTLLASRLMHGNYVDDPNVIHRLAQRVEIVSDIDLPFSIDGEKCEGRRFAFEIVPKALRVVVGPEYSPVASPALPIEAEPANGMEAELRPSRERLFGLLTGFLLVLKRIRSGPGLLLLGLVALLLSVWFAQSVAAGEWSEFNARALNAIRSHRTEFLNRAALSITWLGGGWGIAFVSFVVLIQLIRTRRYLTAGTFLAVLIGVLLLEAVLKPLFALVRPVITDGLVTEASYAFPSGHALRGVGIFGLMAYLAARHAGGPLLGWIGSAICAAVAIGICWSRVYLGVHWVTDVIMGAWLAAIWVGMCLFARRQVELRSPVAASVRKYHFRIETNETRRDSSHGE